jgi:hypothetical protein
MFADEQYTVTFFAPFGITYGLFTVKENPEFVEFLLFASSWLLTIKMLW